MLSFLQVLYDLNIQTTSDQTLFYNWLFHFHFHQSEYFILCFFLQRNYSVPFLKVQRTQNIFREKEKKINDEMMN